jgi:lipid-binding SYLF domain-containing protein
VIQDFCGQKLKENDMKKFLLSLMLVSLVATPVFAAPSEEDCQQTLERFRSLAETNSFLSQAVGYAIFPTIGKGGIGIGGAYGEGCVYKGGARSGSVKMGQVTFGFQLGGQAYSQLVIFKSGDAYDTFTKGSFEFGADATAVALTYGAQAGVGTKGASASAGEQSGGAEWYRGMAVFTLAKGGLMYEASVGGQKFDFKPAQ